MTNRPLKVGDILSYSWGYEQTNIDWFRVVRATKASVWIVPISGSTTDDGNMSGTTVPNVDDHGAPDAKPQRKARKQWPEQYGGDECVVMAHGFGKLWDGTPKRCSWYY